MQQASNSIGGAIPQDGTLVAAQNYTPGGINAFDARTLTLVADVPAEYEPGKLSPVVDLADLPGQRFIFSPFGAGAIRIADFPDGAKPSIDKMKGIGKQSYDALGLAAGADVGPLIVAELRRKALSEGPSAGLRGQYGRYSAPPGNAGHSRHPSARGAGPPIRKAEPK